MPEHKEHKPMLEWPDELYGLEWLSGFWGEVHLRFAPLFSEPPDLVVIHSAWRNPTVGEFLSNPLCPLDHEPTEKDPTKAKDGCRLVDGRWYQVAAVHLAWYEGATRKLRPHVAPPTQPHAFVQMASLRRSTPGAGGSVCQGRGGVNGRAIHIELPARPRDVSEVCSKFRAVMGQLTEALPSLRYWTMHRVIDPKHRSDPVPSTGFDKRWIAGFGLEFAGREG